jgi:hypothetical protein
MRALRSRRAATNALATIALVFGLAGGSYGAFKLPRNSVRSSSIVDGQVKAADLASGAVTAGDVAPHAIGPNAFVQGGLPSGTNGVRGPAGDKGPAGDAGARGSTTARYRLTAPLSVPSQTYVPIMFGLTPDPSWTQGTHETDLVTIRLHATAIGPPCVAFVEIDADAAVVASAAVAVTGDGGSGHISGLTAPDAATPRSLTAGVINTCPSTSFVIDAVDVDVVRAG